jgi:hypothetical protein
LLPVFALVFEEKKLFLVTAKILKYLADAVVPHFEFVISGRTSQGQPDV